MKKRLITLMLALSLAFALAIPAGAAGNAGDLRIDDSMLSTLTDIYENENVCQLFDGQGNDVTAEFLARHRDNYNSGNYAPIVEDIVENDISAVLPVVEMIGPRMVVNYTVSAQISMPYTVSGTAYTAKAKLQITSQINDYDGQFISVSNGVLTDISKGYTSAIVSGGGTSTKIDGNGKRFVQQASFIVKVGTKKEISNWSAIAFAGENILRCTKVDQSGDL